MKRRRIRFRARLDGFVLVKAASVTGGPQAKTGMRAQIGTV